MIGPIKTDVQIITQAFKGDAHRGVDLRSIDFSNWSKLKVQTVEPCTVLRQGVDGYGNDYLAVETEEDKYELKYIHVSFDKKYAAGTMLPGSTDLGITQTRQEIGRGNSQAHHLHFEAWKDGKPIDPVEYFYERHIKYGFK